MSEPNNKESPVTESSSVGLVVVLVIFMIVLMVASIYYPFPDGKSLGLGDFVLLWFREILIVGLFLVVGIAWLFQTIRKKHRGRTPSAS